MLAATTKFLRQIVPPVIATLIAALLIAGFNQAFQTHLTQPRMAALHPEANSEPAPARRTERAAEMRPAEPYLAPVPLTPPPVIAAPVAVAAPLVVAAPAVRQEPVFAEPPMVTVPDRPRPLPQAQIEELPAPPQSPIGTIVNTLKPSSLFARAREFGEKIEAAGNEILPSIRQ